MLQPNSRQKKELFAFCLQKTLIGLTQHAGNERNFTETQVDLGKIPDIRSGFDSSTCGHTKTCFAPCSVENIESCFATASIRVS